MLNIVTIIGARPQFIKAAAVSHAIAEHGRKSGGGISEFLLHTGQHYDHNLSDVFFRELGLAAPVHNLGVGSGSHARQTGAIMRGLETFLTENRPDIVVIYGDTNSTLAAALVAAKLSIPLAHIEAGLRSRNMRMPEEINRIVADRLSTILFTGSQTARENLNAEGLGERIADVGDVMQDTIRLFAGRADIQDRLNHFGLTRGGYALATLHRAENTDDSEKLTRIFAGLRAVAGRLPVVLPLHPRTALALSKLDGNAVAGLNIIEPASYLDMIALERGSRLILTDSGGVQKEAYFQGVPCVTLRNETEWIETVHSGWNRLAAPDRDEILAAATDMLALDTNLDRPEFYGDGHAAGRIVVKLLQWHEQKAGR